MTTPKLLLALLLCALLSTRLSAQEARSALVMGVWQYSDPMFQSLPGIEDDVKKMGAKLKELGFEVTTVTNPTLGEAKDAVDTFGAALRKRKGVALFYYSGHGCENDGKNYLIPRGTKIRTRADLADEALSAQRILNRMEEAGTAVNLIFLDACRNSLSKGGDTGLAPMQANGTFIGFATASERSANATASGSVYTAALLKHIATPAISIFDMHTFVTKEVREETADAGQPQVPFQYSGLDQVFYFVPPASPARPVAPHQLDDTVLPPAARATQRLQATATLPDGTGRIVVTMSKPAYRIGDGLGCDVSLDRDAFVRVVQFGSDGSTTQLFPNAFDRDNFVHAAAPLRLPGPKYRLRTNPPAGEEKIVVFVSEGQFADNVALLHSATRGAEFPGLRRNAVLDTRGVITVEAVGSDHRQTPVIGVSLTYRLTE